MMRKIVYLILFFCTSSIFAQTFLLSGKIKDTKGNPLSFASVIVKGTTIGTNSNAEGNFSLRLKPGNYNMLFQYVGYKKEEKQIVLNKDLNIDVVLASENYELKEVQVKAGEDPAYEVIRQAIKKRKYYLNQVNSYSCRAYIKGLQRLYEIPKNLGKLLKITTGENPIDSSMLGVIYLSESESKYYFRKPNDEKEIMYSSKVSGNNSGFSFNQLSDMKFNFYENLVSIGGLSDRPFISPINENAFLSYRYKLIGTTFEDGKMINKIEVIPKRGTDPCFRGIIYITENSWRIHSADLHMTKESKIKFVDTLEIRQLYAPVKGDSIWMPISFNFGFKFKIFGFRGNGYYNAVVSDYEINPAFSDKFFKNELLKVEEDANKKDTSYWKNNRPIPLTKEEMYDYRKKDSITKITDTRHYKDSIDKKFNRFKLQSLILGYNYRSSYNKINFGTTGLLTSGVQYNTVEGINASMNFKFTKEFENFKNHEINGSIRYGFSNFLWGGKVGWSYLQNPKKFQQFAVNLQSMVTQYNSSNPISESMNSIYTLYLNDNFMKLYKKTSVQFYYRRELINGLYFYGNIEFAERASLKNSTDMLITDDKNKLFTSNDPLHVKTHDSLFQTNNSLVVDVMFRIRFKQKYYTVPNRKIISGSKYPRVNIAYKKAIPVTKTSADYDLATIQLDDNIRMGLLGNLTYRGMAGYFLNNKTMYFMDYKHFNGNQTVLANRNTLSSFKLLPYYTFSTKNWYAEGHAEHHFNGFIFNKIPLLRKTRITEVIGAHVLVNDKMDQYYELSFGVEKILQLIRFDYAVGYGPYGKFSQGFLIGLDIDF